MQTERKTYRKICQHCGKEFIALTSVTAYCSHRCASLALKNKKRDERLKSTSIETRELKRLALLDKNFLSLSDAARLMQISRTTLYRIITIYSIPLHKFTDRTVRISREDLDKAARGQVTAFDTSPSEKDDILSNWMTREQIMKEFGLTLSWFTSTIKRHQIKPRIIDYICLQTAMGQSQRQRSGHESIHHNERNNSNLQALKKSLIYNFQRERNR